MANGADLIVRYLKEEGVRFVFGVAGSSILDLMDAIARDGTIRFIPTQDERAASYMADGFARVTGGELGVCCATVGPGATNLIGGVAQAGLESSPVMALVGEVSTLHYGKGASNFHEIDQVGVYRPITKLAVRIERADRIGEFMQQALRAAQSGRKGPVYVGLPRDIQKAEIGDSTPPARAQYRPSTGVRPAEGLAERAADLLCAAKRPVIIAAGGVRWARAQQEIKQLAELLGAPIVTTHKGLVSEDFPLCMGIMGTSSSPIAQQTVHQADRLLALGCTFSQVATGSFGGKVIAKGTPIIQVDIDPREIGKNYPVELGVMSDIKAFLHELLPLVSTRVAGVNGTREGRIQEARELKERWRQELTRQAAASASELPSRLAMLSELRQVLEHDAIVAAESGSTHGWAQYGFEFYEPILEPGDYSIMGSGYCMAMAAKLAYPERQVVSLTGDGAMMMVLNELATAVAQKIDLVVVVPHNNIYGNMLRKQHTHFQDRFIGTELYVPDLARVAEALGAHGERVERAEDLRSAYERALNAGKPALVDVVVESSNLEELEAPTKLRVPDRY